MMLDNNMISRDLIETLLTWIYPAILSGQRTQEKSIIGSGMTMTAEMVMKLLSTDIRIWGYLISRAARGAKGFFGEYGYVLKTGHTQIDLTDSAIAGVKKGLALPSQPDALVKRRFKELWKAAGFRGVFGKVFATSFLPVFRNIPAFDQILTNSASEFNIALKEYQRSDKNLSIAKRIEAANARLFNNIEKDIEAEVVKEIEEMKEALAKKKENIKNLQKLKPTGWRDEVKSIKEWIRKNQVPTGYKTRRTRAILNSLRDADFVKAAYEEAKLGAYVGTPLGGWGALYDKLITFIEGLLQKDSHGASKVLGLGLKGLTLFMRIGFNVAQMGLNWTPIGAAKAARLSMPERWVEGTIFKNLNKQWNKGKMKRTPKEYRRRVLAQSMLGMAVGLAIFNNMFDWDEDDEEYKLKDEKDMYLVVTANGTGHWYENQTMSEGWKPWSAKWRFSLDSEFTDWHSYAYNPLAFVLAPWGLMHDDLFFKDFQTMVKADKTDMPVELAHPNKDWLYLTTLGMRGIPMFLMEQSFNKVANTLGKIFTSNEPEELSKNIAKIFTDPTMAVVPNFHKQTYDEYKSLAGIPEKERYGIIDSAAKGAPFFDALMSNQKYDILGYDVIKEFELPFIPESWYKWMTDNVNYRTGKPDWELLWKYENVVLASVYPPKTHRHSETKKTVEWTDSDRNIYVKTTGDMLRGMILNKNNKVESYLDKLNPHELLIELLLLHEDAKKDAHEFVSDMIELRIYTESRNK
jgi:hypothetical protein